MLGRGEPALHHARRCLALCASAAVEPFDLPFAHEALARAYLLLGDRDRAGEHYRSARQLATAITDDDDRTIVETDLASLGLDAE